mgnify:CR=1 FL=1
MLLAFCVVAAITMSAQTFTTLVDFDQTNGGQPAAALVQGLDGNLYGTTSSGGANNGGTVFRMTPEGKLTTVYSFCSKANCTDGSDPGQILLGNDGNFYGFTITGGANCLELSNSGCGTIFKITPAGTFSTIYSFCALTNCADGWAPNALIQGPDGNFYGITRLGGPYNDPDGTGEVFKLTPAGALSIVYGFCRDKGSCSDGEEPAGLMQGSNGNFYGTTDGGGGDGCGTIYELSHAGALTILHSSTPNQGCDHTGVMQASDGNFYGTTTDGGGAHRMGSVYKLTPSGVYSILYGFCAEANCADGDRPGALLVQGTDGNLYGTTHGAVSGAQTTDGTVFEISTGGALTTLHSFDFTDGALPSAALVQATNGTFYGTTSGGGLSKCTVSCGTVFSISTGLGPFVEALPNYGTPGRTVRILGNNLAGTTSVTFNGVEAAFDIRSNTFIQTWVPSGATSGTIEVTTPSGTLSSNAAFQVLP